VKRVAARFPLVRVGEARTLSETSPDLVDRIVVSPWASLVFASYRQNIGSVQYTAEPFLILARSN
jgi:hypothetical protein